jgi:hypothetical protein
MSIAADNVTEEPKTSDRKADGKFALGNRANPSGRPKGSRHKYLLAAEALLDGESERLSRKAIEMALAGDTTCLRICLERILPVRRDRPIGIELPQIKTLEDVASALLTVVQAVGSGEITPSEGTAVSSLLHGYSEALQAKDLEARIAVLEARNGLKR